MQTEQLVSFYHVARLHSVSKAARRLHLGQPTVTTHLRKLETEFGILLFDRFKRPIQLTPEGATILELVTPILKGLDALKSYVNHSERMGAFTVGAYPDLALHYLPTTIRSFRVRYPDVHIRLVARPYASLLQLVKSDEVDLALCSRPPSEDLSLEFVELFQYNLVLFTPLGHELLAQHPITLQDIARWPLILFGPETNSRQRVEQALEQQGIDYEVALEVDSSELIKRYVEIGMGVALCGDFTLQPEDTEKLGVVRLDHLFSSSAIGVCTLKGKFLGRSLHNFIDVLKEQSSAFYPKTGEGKETEEQLVPIS